MSQTDIARPENPTPLSEADIYAACKAFVAAYALPAMVPENICEAWNQASLPTGANDYAIITVISDTQHGTTVETFRAEDPDITQPGVLTAKGLIEVLVQVACYAPDDVARQRARRLAMVTGSGIGVQFFNDLGMSALYADGVQELPSTAAQQLMGYSTTLHLSYWAGVSADFPYFDAVKISRLENVDVSHPVNTVADNGQKE